MPSVGGLRKKNRRPVPDPAVDVVGGLIALIAGCGFNADVSSPSSDRGLPSPLVFYDGQCGLCSRSVQWFIKRDRRRVLHFAPLQGETAAAALPAMSDDSTTWSMILRDENGLHYNSDGVIRAVTHLGGPWRMVKPLLILPRSLRDAAYRFIAKRRYRWFDKHDACWVGDAQTHERFLP